MERRAALNNAKKYVATMGADKCLARPTSRYILFEGKSISFDTSLVIYINSTNIPTIIIINRIYEHQIFCRCSLSPSWTS